jgi:hypothetical protein
VRFRALEIRPTPEGYAVERELPVLLEPYELSPVLGFREELRTSGSPAPRRA